MEPLYIDMHIHSMYSHDSMMHPRQILKRAKKVGLTGIAITDHDTIRGSIAAKKLAKEFGITVLLGTEIRTDIGDIIGIQITEEIRDRAWHDVVDAIRDQNGIVILPHPYRDHQTVDELATAVDLIEIWNARCTVTQNEKAAQLSRNLQKPGVYGSDAHTAAEIGNVIVMADCDRWNVTHVIRANQSSRSAILQSYAIHYLKRHEFLHAIQAGWRYLWKNVD